jgi:hypothetical protein
VVRDVTRRHFSKPCALRKRRTVEYDGRGRSSGLFSASATRLS